MKISLAILFLFCLSGCQIENPSDKPDRSSQTSLFAGNVMTIDYRILVGRKLSKDEAKQVHVLIASVFHEVNEIYNNWNPNSEISEINSLPANIEIKLSDKLANFLERTSEIVNLTEGRFDPTIRPLHALWKSHLELGQIPDQKAIEEAAKIVGWHHIHLDGNIFCKDFDQTSLDLGGIAKGYCVDLLVESLNSRGFPDVFVEWGGEIRSSGNHPEGRPWSIFISHLGDQDPGKAAARLSISDQAIATSGDYNQCWQVFTNGSITGKPVIYFHIVNPFTMIPLQAKGQSIASASVIASSCMLADALATTSMMFESVEDAEQWALHIQNLLPSTDFYFITRN